MTEKEINKKAEKHCNEVLCNGHEKCNEVIKCRDWRSRRAGFFCGYEQALKDKELKRSRWHNLRKNPQDLPKEDGAVLVVDMDYGHPGYKVALFWKKDGAFTGHYLAKLDVIAWREIPVFQE